MQIYVELFVLISNTSTCNYIDFSNPEVIKKCAGYNDYDIIELIACNFGGIFSPKIALSIRQESESSNGKNFCAL